MKKRDLFWTTRLICFFAIILLFTFLFFHHIIQFNSSYIQEEKDELNVFRKQIQWAVTPYLEKEDMENMQKTLKVQKSSSEFLIKMAIL